MREGVHVYRYLSAAVASFKTSSTWLYSCCLGLTFYREAMKVRRPMSAGAPVSLGCD